MSTNEEDSESEKRLQPGPLADDLASEGYRRTDSTCPEDDCGQIMWYNQNMLVCDTCSYSVDLEARRSSKRLDSPWEEYKNNPPRYKNSNRVRMPGGFPSAYEWVSSEDVDDAISSVAADDFYR